MNSVDEKVDDTSMAPSEDAVIDPKIRVNRMNILLVCLNIFKYILNNILNLYEFSQIPSKV